MTNKIITNDSLCVSTPDIMCNYPDIVFKITQKIHEAIFNSNYDEHMADIIMSNITIDIKTTHIRKNKNEKLKNIGTYQKIHNSENNKTCSICLDNFKPGTFKRKMPQCRHEFHKKCIDEWLYKDNKLSCPICRTFQGIT